MPTLIESMLSSDLSFPIPMVVPLAEPRGGDARNFLTLGTGTNLSKQLNRQRVDYSRRFQVLREYCKSSQLSITDLQGLSKAGDAMGRNGVVYEWARRHGRCKLCKGGKAFKGVETFFRELAPKFGRAVVALKDNNDEAVSTDCFPLDGSYISCFPPEVNLRIFSLLTQGDIFNCRKVCASWRAQIDFMFAFHTTLTPEKMFSAGIRFKKPISLEISCYYLEDLTFHLKHKHYLRVPEPRGLVFAKKISSKNFLKIIDCWRNLEMVTFFVEPLESGSLYENWCQQYPLEYFPRLRSLSLSLDRLRFSRFKQFDAKQLCYNLDQILLNPYPNLESLCCKMLNMGRNFVCAFVAPIIMFIGRQKESIRRVTVAFHTGSETEHLPNFPYDQHAPASHIALDDQIYIHGEINLCNLLHTKLTHCFIALPSIKNCTTRNGICNYFSKLLTAQHTLQAVHVETQLGVSCEFVQTITTLNQNSIREIELTIELAAGDVLNLNVFSSCRQLRRLRLKRVGVNEVFSQVPQIKNTGELPPNLERLWLQRFHISILDLHVISTTCEQLCCLFIRSCFVIDNKEGPDCLSEEVILGILLHQRLEYVSFDPVLRHTLRGIEWKLKNSLQLKKTVYRNKWSWAVMPRETNYSQPRMLLLYRQQESFKKIWFKPYYYEKPKLYQ